MKRFLLIISLVFLFGCNYYGKNVIVYWDWPWNPIPENCYEMAHWEIKHYKGEGHCYLVTGIAGNGEAHAEFWLDEDGDGPAEAKPVGFSYLTNGGTVYLQERVKCGSELQ